MYVALDTPEILYAAKTVALFMQFTTKSAVAMLKRGALAGRVLSGRVGLLRRDVPKYLDAFSDSDWAGDEGRKRSTTGVAEIFGGPPLDATAGTLVDCRRATSWPDSSAYRGIVRRQGTGRLRHMWTQEPVQQGEFMLKSVGTGENVAAIMTKHLAEARRDHLNGRTDHVATVSLALEVMLLLVGCVALVLAFVVLAAAGAYCCWRWASSSGGVVRLATLGVGGLALTDDAGAIGWIVETCKEKTVHNCGCGAISDVRRRRSRLKDLGGSVRENSHGARSCRLRAAMRCKSSLVTERR